MSKVKEFIHSLDLYQTPVSINYNGKQGYPSVFGGILSILIGFFILLYIIVQSPHLYGDEEVRDRDTFMTVINKKDLLERDPMKLMNSSIDFTIIVNDKAFNNSNSSFGEFKLLIVNDTKGKIVLHEVPLKENDCNISHGFTDNPAHVFAVDGYNTYCPDFSDEHQLKNDYYSTNSSWMRLALLECDPSKRNCSSRKEMDDYWRKTILEIQMRTDRPLLKEYNDNEEDVAPISTFYVDSHFAVRDIKDLVTAEEFFIRESMIELDEDTTGLVYVPPVQHPFQEWYKSNFKIIKSHSDDFMSKDNLLNVEMLQYWNFQLVKDETFYIREKFKLFELFGEIGGIATFLSSTITFIFSFLLYKKHEIQVQKEYYENQLHKTLEDLDDGFDDHWTSIKLFMADVFGSCCYLSKKTIERNDDIERIIKDDFDLKQILRIKQIEEVLDKKMLEYDLYDKQIAELYDHLKLTRIVRGESLHIQKESTSGKRELVSSNWQKTTRQKYIFEAMKNAMNDVVLSTPRKQAAELYMIERSNCRMDKSLDRLEYGTSNGKSSVKMMNPVSDNQDEENKQSLQSSPKKPSVKVPFHEPEEKT